MVQQNNFLFSAFLVSLGIFLAVIFYIAGFHNTAPIWNSNIANQITLIIMIIFLFLWFLSWLIFDAIESQDVDDKVGHFLTPTIKFFTYVLLITIPLAFSAMVISVGNVSIFIPLMGAVVLGTSIGDHIVIRKLIQDVQQKPDIDQALLKYYLKRPHMLLHCFQLFLLALAGAAYLFIIHSREVGSEWIVYIILSISILINESFIWKWRYERIQEEEKSKATISTITK